uniref:Putative odorant binding protein 35 n=1 Tax=Nasonia vitripennis TaxID=7425 RepID=G8B1P0_NASVI|nr:putative odorant binding protein 35 [Nasonia vitripennis]
MKLFFALFVLSFALLHSATGAKDSLVECLQENGLKMVDLDFMRKIKPNTDMPRNKLIEDKLACAFACSFNRDNSWKDENVFTFMTDVIKKDYRIPVGLKKQMLDTLKSCNAEAKGDDCTLLQCIKVTRYPFMDFVFLHNTEMKPEYESSQDKQI